MMPGLSSDLACVPCANVSIANPPRIVVPRSSKRRARTEYDRDGMGNLLLFGSWESNIESFVGPEYLERRVHFPAQEQQPAVFIRHAVPAISTSGKIHVPVAAVQVVQIILKQPVVPEYNGDIPGAL